MRVKVRRLLFIVHKSSIFHSIVHRKSRVHQYAVILPYSSEITPMQILHLLFVFVSCSLFWLSLLTFWPPFELSWQLSFLSGPGSRRPFDRLLRYHWIHRSSLKVPVSL